MSKSIVFSDINKQALKNTKENLKNNGIKENYKIINSDLFDNIPEKFDCIFANLPISNDAFKLKEKTEDIVLKFLQECKNHIKESGKIFFTWGSFENIDPLIKELKKLNYKYKITKESKLGFTWFLIEIKPN